MTGLGLVAWWLGGLLWGLGDLGGVGGQFWVLAKVAAVDTGFS